MFGYTDIYVTAQNSCELIHCILEGRIQDFYLTENVYTLPTYILYAAWNIPFYMCERLAGIGILENNFYYVIFNLWNKILPYLFAMLFVNETVKLAEDLELSVEKRKWIKYLMIFSSYILFFTITIWTVLYFLVCFLNDGNKRTY